MSLTTCNGTTLLLCMLLLNVANLTTITTTETTIDSQSFDQNERLIKIHNFVSSGAEINDKKPKGIRALNTVKYNELNAWPAALNKVQIQNNEGKSGSEAKVQKNEEAQAKKVLKSNSIREHIRASAIAGTKTQLQNNTVFVNYKLSTYTNHINKWTITAPRRLKRSQLATKKAEPTSTATQSYTKLVALAQTRFNSFDSPQIDQQFGLPSVPLPAPPPLPAHFGLTPFSSGAGGGSAFGNAFSSSSSSSSCGGVLKARQGVIQTPNFPHKFQTPIECVWIIDASELALPPTANITIVVYLTQLYVLGGLKFTEYMYYSDDYKVPAHRVFTLTEDDVTQVAWVPFASQYLEIRFSMASLDGTHLRALDRLLDVYGFNITYEVQDNVKPYQCNTLQCRFLGHCYAAKDFASYYCACFPGFSGIDCGRGPLCEDPHTNICQNGGTCKHIGDAAITCHCPAGFKGTKCEIPEINENTMGCTSNASVSDCHRECDFEPDLSGLQLVKTSRNAARSGKTRYEVTIRLGANLTAFYRHTEGERRASDHLPSLLDRHLMRVLRNFNITKISDLELISNSTDRLDITFHFFGIKGDSNRIREAITRMVERGRIGNITLVSNYHIFEENPPLNLLDMTINQKSAIREDSEFIISCTAQGSARMQFQWFKDGAIVNASKATREIWTTVLPPETKNTFTAILGVTKANRMDEGIYTCKITDWGVEQCRSMHVHIKSPPRLRVDPASVTLHRGDSLRVRCLSPGNDDIKRYAQLGYSWTRNGVLFQSDPAKVMWEDLYPDGSILKINNIQKSAEYSCMVSNTVKPVSKSVYITVIDRNAVHVCHAETLYGVRWPTSAPGAAIISDCPRGFEGHSRRICEKRDVGNSTWLLPDFSTCIRDQLLQIYNRFRALSSGFQQTNSSAILKACFQYTIRRYKHFLPGEASFLIDMLHEVDSYLQLKGTQLEREMAAEIILHILDKVMQNTQSLNTQQQIKKLQLLTQSAALNRETIAASQLATSTVKAASPSATSSQSGTVSVSMSAAQAADTGTAAAATLTPSSPASSAASAASSSAISTAGAPGLSVTTMYSSNNNNRQPGTLLHTDNTASILTVDEDSLSLDRLNSLRIYMTSVKTLPFNLRIYGDDLFSDQLYMDIGLSPRLLNIMANSTIFTSVISYKNLKSFLPKTYYTRGSDPKDADYILASRIIQTWLFQSNRSNDNFREPLDLPFEAGHVEIIFQHESAPKNSDWTAVCGHDYKASFESTWRSDLCITKNLMDNITHCICPLSGTYVVMLIKRNAESDVPHVAQHPIFVVISCACCLLQSCSAFIILLPIWYNRKCAITFLKMQFCISTSSIMLIFLLGFLKMLPVNWHAITSSSLASLLLLGISTLIAIALVIHSEMVPKKCLSVTKGSSAATPKTNSTLTLTKAQEQQQQQQQQQQQHHEMQKAHSFTSGSSCGNINISNITQISSNTTNNSNNSNNSSSQSSSNSLRRPTAATTTTAAGIGRTHDATADINLPSSVRGAIGISWLLPLLFAITSPLICSIIGKWPQNWWLEVKSNMNSIAPHTQDGATSGAGVTTQTHLPILLNGDNFSERTITTTTTTSTAAAAATSATANAAGATNGAFTLTTTDYYPSTATSSQSSSSSMASSFSSSISAAYAMPTFPQYHNVYGASKSDVDALDSYTNEQSTLSFSFVTFVCVDLLFVLLFCALVAILFRKLWWLSRRNRNVSTHPLDKFNVAMSRRVGLMHRTLCLLISKLCTDAFFIVYVNSSLDSLWCYPFGISCVLLGFSILFCFVIKAEYNLRAPATSAGGGNSGGPLQHKKKLKASKASLDDTFCSSAINNPLSFYTAHEKEKESESGAPPPLTHLLTAQQQIELATTGSVVAAGGTVQLPLTVISTSPRCQLLPASGVETFLGAGTLERKSFPPHIACLQDMQGGGVVGGGVAAVAHAHLLPSGMTIAGYYEASCGKRAQQQQLTAHEFVGVETLDILQGVAPDSIIGIRTGSNMLPTVVAAPPTTVTVTATATQYHQHIQQQQQQQSHHMLPMGAITTSSVTTQTPKAQKRVTIMEPTTHTFDPMLPTMVAASTGGAVANTAANAHLLTTANSPQQQLTPIITITCSSLDVNDVNASTTATTTATTATATTSLASASSTPDDENSINGMFDRITHDLDYLLNRTNEIPSTPTTPTTARLMGSVDSTSVGATTGEVAADDDIPPPPLPPSSSIPLDVTPATTTTAGRVDAIIEETEQEL